MRGGMTGALLMLAGVLAGCADPKPGLEDETRAETVIDCKSVIGHFAPTERKKEQLCECTTAKLAAQSLTLADLSGPKRDRAMEQLRWCGQQVGVFGKGGKAGKPVADTPAPDEEAADGKAVEKGEVGAEPPVPEVSAESGS